MHPLDKGLDESLHRQPPVRRRSSLDNSSLSAQDTFRVIVSDETSPKSAPKRRLSLNTKVKTTTTFLAKLENHQRPKADLDEDFHSSAHSRSSFHPPGPSKSTSSMGTGATMSTSFHDDDVDGYLSSTSLDDDDDADSFCDASVQEQANREYLRKDLGASCYWSSLGDGALLSEDDDESESFDDYDDKKHQQVVEISIEDDDDF